MKIWFDTEFIEDGKTIDLLSIGMVREDGQTLYIENKDADLTKASPWVVENVLPHLQGSTRAVPKWRIAQCVQEFADKSPEFWAYYCSYDWVVLCQLFGTMMDLPDGWPMFCRDVQQEFMRQGGKAVLPKQENEHDALADALWTRAAWQALQ